MKTLPVLAALGAVGLGADLSTDYTRQRSLRIETKLSLEMETTSFHMERNGEPVEGRGGGGNSEESRTIVQIDQFLASADGAPTRVKRTFADISGETTTTMGENSFDRSLEGLLSGVTLELVRGEGEDPEVSVVDGTVDDTELLEGHRLELALDALLPSEEVEKDSSWELDEEAIERALGVDLAAILFRQSEEAAGEGRPEGGRGGGRGFGGRMGGGGGFNALSNVEWKGSAKVVELEESFEDETCVRIELELEGEGELPAPEFGRGRDREFVLGLPNAGRDENSIEARFEGSFWVAVEGRRPRALSLSGEIKMETSFERDNGEFQMSMSSTREGKCDLEIHVTEEK